MALPKWMDQPRSTKKSVSKIQEINTAKAFRGKTIVASGALWFAKSDVKSDLFQIECKYTSKVEYILEYKTLEKIRQEAANEGKIPLMEVWFKDSKEEKKYVIINKSDFYRFKNFGTDIVPTIIETKSIRLKLNEADKYGYPLFIVFKSFNNDSFVVIERDQFLGYVDESKSKS